MTMMSNLQLKQQERRCAMPYYDDEDDSDDGYDAARDAYLTGDGPPVTRKQREEEEAWNEECRRNKRK
jgi:hypothetical protein